MQVLADLDEAVSSPAASKHQDDRLAALKIHCRTCDSLAFPFGLKPQVGSPRSLDGPPSVEQYILQDNTDDV